MTRISLRWRSDMLAVVILVLVWLAFFWRFFTPIPGDQVSLMEGDFSGQFVAFGAYQAARLWQGEVPLWNPYNNGGLPFLADSQSAVFYPPRLLTVALSGLDGGWTYHALELEMTAHVLVASLLMYVLVRRLTVGQVGSVAGGLAAAITWAYGGFMTGYPPLQLALLDAVVWGPLLLLGVHEAMVEVGRVRWPWLVVSGLALGLSALAGHPQANWFLGLLALAYLAFRVYQRRDRWTVFIVGAVGLGMLALILAAVQLLPAYEYLQHATRIDMGFEARRNGFPVNDVIQVLFPRVLSVWSPLYVGIVGLVLAVVAVWQRVRGWMFWGGAALLGLGLSFGGNTAFYGALVNVVPGLRLFRGQERAAIVIALVVSVLAGLGMARLAAWDPLQEFKQARQLRRGLALLLGVTLAVTGAVFVLWLGPNREVYVQPLPAIAFSALVAALTLPAIGWLLGQPTSFWRQGALIVLIAFDLLTVAQDNLMTDPVPPTERLQQPAILAAVLADEEVPPQRVDGRRGLLANYGTLWSIPDIRGISPLWLSGPHAIIQEDLPEALAWELLAVRYVITDWEQLPVPSTIVDQGYDPYGPVNVHRLDNPRPFALLMDHVAVVDSDAFALALLADSRFDPRQNIILLDDGTLALPDDLGTEGQAFVSTFAPETVIIQVEGNSAPAVLSLSLPHYPGWTAAVDGEATTVLRAYGALSAVILPANASEVVLTFQPLTVTRGAIVSLAGWGGVLLFGVWLLIRRVRRLQPDAEAS